jgi:hypothetical protein
MSTNPLTAGALSVGAIISSTINAGANPLTAGALSVGTIISGSHNMAANALTAGNISVGTITSSDVTSGNISAISISPMQYVESISSLTYSASVTASFTNGTLFSVPSVTGAITTLAITNIPTTPNRSYTMSFILATTGSSGYISAGSITVNGTSISLKGTINASTPTTYIVQQISLFNIGGTFTAITSASFF